MREYNEGVVVEMSEQQPARFIWRRQEYLITAVLTRWRERTSWWLSTEPAEHPLELERAMWRVEARRVAGRARGVFELRQSARGWALVRALD